MRLILSKMFTAVIVLIGFGVLEPDANAKNLSAHEVRLSLWYDGISHFDGLEERLLVEALGREINKLKNSEFEPAMLPEELIIPMLDV
jgi:hypothetical protein